MLEDAVDLLEDEVLENAMLEDEVLEDKYFYFYGITESILYFFRKLSERKATQHIATQRNVTKQNISLGSENLQSQIVLNGRTAGDIEGNVTYISSNGSAVNDLCTVSQEMLTYVETFTVEEREWSDHMPLVISLKLQCEIQQNTERKLLPTLKWKDANRVQYSKKLKENIRTKLQNKTHLDLSDLTDVILKSTPKIRKCKGFYTKKSKWYNFRCFVAKKKAKHLLRKYRRTESSATRANYLEANKKYKDVCLKSKAEYYRNLETRINTIKNGKEWWKLVKELRNRPLINEVRIAPNEFKTHFENLLNHTQTAKDVHYAPNFIEIDELDKPIMVGEILQVLKKAKDGKAPGLDRIPYEFYKNANTEFLEQLAKAYNQMYDSGRADSSSEPSIIFPIHKKGDSSVITNYRGVAFMNTKAKILMGVLNERLSSWVENNNIMSEYQAGFRKNYSTVDNLYNLTSII
ncbi:uncharacterized protein LOC119688228 [Teleopsis dalmanni]|uniref:uncharacterized protein LOC119688228 n=1 Tax=Teleopsis dalmanni TaxID=139649 RepID=UPI0018CE4469|nr:uncharacterized protein LOC119688228 [Teleopsis dalmanni]